jgi:predicted Zn-dependent peptidase
MMRAIVPWALILWAGSGASAAPLDLSGMSGKFQEFKLANGFTVAVVERKDAPVVSATLVVRAGYAMDPPGKRGLAALFELLLEEGPDSRATLNLTAEKAAMKDVETAVDRWESLRRSGSSSEVDVQRAAVDAKMARERAAGMTIPRYIRRALDFHNADSFRISVGPEATFASARLPSSRVEAFFLLFGEWMQRPFPRNFYLFRETLATRAAAPVPQDQRVQAAIAESAFAGHPYAGPRMVAAEIGRLRAADFEQFARRYYTASNSGLVLVGDISPQEARRLAELHFGKLASGDPDVSRIPPAVPATVKVVPPQEIAAATAVFYPRPPASDPDDIVFDRLVPLVMAGNRSLAWKRVVEKDRLASGLMPIPQVPGGAAGGLTGIAVAARPDRSVASLVEAIAAPFEELAGTPIEDADWEFSLRQLQLRIVESLADAQQAANLLAQNFAVYGSAKELFAAAGRLDAVTREDVKRVAARYFTAERRSVLAPATAPAPAASNGAAR